MHGNSGRRTVRSLTSTLALAGDGPFLGALGIATYTGIQSGEGRHRPRSNGITSTITTHVDLLGLGLGLRPRRSDSRDPPRRSQAPSHHPPSGLAQSSPPGRRAPGLSAGAGTSQTSSSGS